MTSEEEEVWIRKAVASFKETSPSGRVPVRLPSLRSRRPCSVSSPHRLDGTTDVPRRTLLPSSPRSTRSSGSSFLSSPPFTLARTQLTVLPTVTSSFTGPTTTPTTSLTGSSARRRRARRTRTRVSSSCPTPWTRTTSRSGTAVRPLPSPSLRTLLTRSSFAEFGSDDAFAQRVIDAFTTIRDEAIKGKRHGYITCALHTVRQIPVPLRPPTAFSH